MLKGPILALDLGVRCGYAIGRSAPRSGTVILKKPDESRPVALSNLIDWLNKEMAREKPALIVKEAALPLQAFRNTGNSEAGVLMAYGMHGIVEAMSGRFGIPLRAVHAATIRKHFIGQGRMGKRAATKAAVIQRCKLLGYMPRDCEENDRADALALWDYAAAVYGGRTAKLLHLFNERAA